MRLMIRFRRGQALQSGAERFASFMYILYLHGAGKYRFLGQMLLRLTLEKFLFFAISGLARVPLILYSRHVIWLQIDDARAEVASTTTVRL